VPKYRDDELISEIANKLNASQRGIRVRCQSMREEFRGDFEANIDATTKRS
jgi:hypothetical protein